MTSNRAWVVAISTLVVALGIASACSSDSSTDLPVYTAMPSFSLENQMGRQFTSQDLQEKVVVANFIFTNCTQFCPVLTPRMGELQEHLREDGLLGSQVALLSFSVDPENDSPEVLWEYSERYGADHDSWHFLTGPPDRVREVITAGFLLAFDKVSQSVEHVHEDGTIHAHGYDVTHTNRVALVDRQGQVRAYYDGATDWDMARVLGDIEHLLE